MHRRHAGSLFYPTKVGDCEAGPACSMRTQHGVPAYSLKQDPRPPAPGERHLLPKFGWLFFRAEVQDQAARPYRLGGAGNLLPIPNDMTSDPDIQRGTRLKRNDRLLAVKRNRRLRNEFRSTRRAARPRGHGRGLIRTIRSIFYTTLVSTFHWIIPRLDLADNPREYLDHSYLSTEIG